MSNWGCPHLVDGKCERVNHLPCELGMKGCVLFGRFRFFDESKNRTKTQPLHSAPDQTSGNESLPGGGEQAALFPRNKE